MQDAITTTDGVLLIANGIDPVLRWDGYAATMDEAGVIPPSAALTVAASGTGTITGTYYVFVRFVDVYGNPSNMSPASDALAASAAGTLTYGNLPVPTQTKVARRQVWRNTAGQAAVFYLDVDSTDLTATSLSSTKTDAQLRSSESLALFDAAQAVLSETNDVPPSTKRFLASHLGRAWMAGEQVYRQGAVAVTGGSSTVTGIGTEWPESFEGRFLWVAGADKPYEIDSVSGQTITLVEPYAGLTDPYADYAIRPPLPERRQVLFSAAGRPEAWPATNALELPDADDEVTGLMPKSSFLFVFESRHLWRISAQDDPADDGFVFLAADRGCVNQRCWLVVGDTALVLDRQGVYAFGGGDGVQGLSAAIQDVFNPADDDAPYKVNWAASHWFHAVFERGHRIARWFVTLAGTGIPRHALCLDVESGRWWVEEWPFPVASSCSAVIDGVERVVLGAAGGGVYFLGNDSDELVDRAKGAVRGSVTGASLLSVTDSAGLFSATDAVGCPLAITDGRGAGQWRLVVEATTSKLTVDRPWDTQPDTTSTYQLGGVQWKYRTGWLRWADGEEENRRRFLCMFKPLDLEATMHVRRYDDRAETPTDWGSTYTSGDANEFASTSGDPDLVAKLNKRAGVVQRRLDGRIDSYADAPRLVSWELDGVTNGRRVKVYELTLDGAVGPGE